MAKSRPWGIEWRSSTLFIVSTVAIGLFTDLFLYGLVVPILPFMLQDRVHLPLDQVQIHVSGLLAAYAGASVIFSPLAGVIADRGASRQFPFLLGLAALLLATLLLLFGQTVAVLVVARILQGISAAVVWTVGLALVLDTVGPENLGKTIGSMFGFISVGELAAPVLGGVLYEKAGYTGVFVLGCGLLAIDFLMRLLLIEKRTAASYKGDNQAEAGPGPEVTDEGSEEDSNASEEDPLIRKKEEQAYKVPPNHPKWIRSFPVIYCLKNPGLLSAFLLTGVQATLLSTFDATIPTVAQQLYNFESLNAGLLFIALSIPYLVLGPIAGWTVDRYGTKPAALIGYLYLFPTLILLRLVRPGGTSEVVKYCALLALCGLGLGVIGASPVVEASNVVQRYHKANPTFFGHQGPYAQLYGLNSMIFSAGLTVGPLASGALKDKIGYGNMNLVLAGVCLIVAILSYIFVGGKPRFLKKS